MSTHDQNIKYLTLEADQALLYHAIPTRLNRLTLEISCVNKTSKAENYPNSQSCDAHDEKTLRLLSLADFASKVLGMD